jgi:hypothetical protein
MIFDCSWSKLHIINPRIRWAYCTYGGILFSLEKEENSVCYNVNLQFMMINDINQTQMDKYCLNLFI